MKSVNAPIMKKDAMALVTGKPVYTDDIAPKDCLVCKILRSPHAHAVIEEINTDIAMKVPGIECILTYEDVPDKRFTMAGQTYPEPSPYDPYAVTLGQEVRVIGPAGEEFEGTAADIDAEGALLVDTAEGRRRVLAGDVSIRPRA